MNLRVIKHFPEWLTRLTIGVLFIQSGWGKLHNLPKVIAYFESLHIPLASIQAPFVSIVELIAGSMVFLGLMTRWASIPLMAIMIVALITAKRSEITDLSSLIDTSEFLYLLLLMWLTAFSTQSFSIHDLVEQFKK